MGLEAGVVGIGLVCGTFTYVKVFVAIVTPVWLSGRASACKQKVPGSIPGGGKRFPACFCTRLCIETTHARAALVASNSRQ
ncbi:hypothetical protein DD237_008283 [Peronospora effusa]|uniref:Uncharacterized protein n=1 Tax=Peronospora effusa TaxID=542832 RepID=A0A3R7W417_9STRA|nr:hypothetical protein DD237_008283 [Peronospora effusa]